MAFRRDGSLKKEKVAVTFAKGVDQITAEKLVVPGSMTRMENGVYNKVGEVEKRNGYDDLSADVDINYPAASIAPYDGPVVLTGESAGVLDEELLLFDGNRVFSRSTEDINWTFVDQATPVVTRSERTVWGSSSPGLSGTSSFERFVDPQHAYQCIYNNGYYVYAWADSDPTAGPSTTYYSVVDADTGDRIVNSQRMGSFFAFRLVASGNFIFFVGSESSFNTTPGNITAWRMDTTNPSARDPWPISAVLVTDANQTAPLMDAVDIDANEFGVTYVRLDQQTPSIRSMRIDTPLAVPVIAFLDAFDVCDRCLSMYRDPSNGNLAVAYINVTGIGLGATEDVKLVVWDALLSPMPFPWPVWQTPGPVGMLINREVIDEAGAARHVSVGPGCNDDYYSVIWDTALGVTDPGWVGQTLTAYDACASKVMIRQCSTTIISTQLNYDINAPALGSNPDGIIGQTLLVSAGGNDGFNPNIYYASLASRQFLRGDEVFFSVVQPTQDALPLVPVRATPFNASHTGLASALFPLHFHGTQVPNIQVGMVLMASDSSDLATIPGVLSNNGVDYQELTVTSVVPTGRIYGTLNNGSLINWSNGTYDYFYEKANIGLIPPVGTPAWMSTIHFPGYATYTNPYIENGIQSSSYGLMRMSRLPDTAATGLVKYSAFGTCSVVGKMADGIAGGVHTQGAVSRVTEVGVNTDKWIFAGGEVALIRSDQNNEVRNIRMTSDCVIDMGDMQNRYESLEKNKTRLTCGGVLSTYDSEQFTAQGWIFPPNVYTTDTKVWSRAAPTDLAQFGIRVVYEWYDNDGQRHQSAPSREVVWTKDISPGTLAGNQITLTMCIYGWLPKDTRAVVYFTERGNQGVGPYYRLTTHVFPGSNPDQKEGLKAFPSSTVTTASGGVQSGTITLGPLYHGDIASGLTSNEILYTNGDVLVNDDAPSSTCIEEWDERVWLGGLEVQNEVAFSKTVFTNEGIFFNNVLRVAVGSELERVVALQAMDDKLVVFKESSIYIIYGDGPNDLGQGATYRAQLITTDQGCTGPKSVVLTPTGILFNTQAGIYRLQRGLQVDFIGARVEDSTAGVTFHGADLVPKKTQARFMLSSGNAVVYDYLVDAWYTFTNHLSAPGGCCVVWKDLFAFLNAGGAMKVQNAGFLDDAAGGTGTYIPTLLETAWIKSGDVEGLQRVYKGLVIGAAGTDHIMTIDVGFDYDAVYTDTKVWTAADIAALPRYQLEIRPSRQRCQAIRFRMHDSGTPPLEDKGYIMTYLMLEVGIQPGLYRRYPIAEARK